MLLFASKAGSGAKQDQADETVSIREANRDFSKIIQDLERTEEGYVVTRRGKPVARIVPYLEDRATDPEWRAAYERMKQIQNRGYRLGGLRVSRDELCDI